MFEPYRVTFIGHRYIEHFREVEVRLVDVLNMLADQHPYLDFYIENNAELSVEKQTIEQLYIAVSVDVDIVFSALNILPSKSGYQFWKDAIFLYLIRMTNLLFAELLLIFH